MNANHATVGLSIDLWNEPDLTYFWNAPQAQYLQMWGRTYHRLRKEWPDVLLIGPAFANQPSTTNDCKELNASVYRILDTTYTTFRVDQFHELRS